MVFVTVKLLSDFVRQVVVVRGNVVLHHWTGSLREDLGSWPYTWIWSDFVHPSPSFLVKDEVAKTSQILLEPHLIDAEFQKAWMPYSCRPGHPVVTVDQVLDFVGPFFLLEATIHLPRITGQGFLGSGLFFEVYGKWSR